MKASLARSVVERWVLLVPMVPAVPLMSLAALAALAGCGGGAPADTLSASPAPAVPAAPAASAATAPGVPAGHVLVWSDEFDQAGLPDPSHWDFDADRNAAGWYNNERQYYSRARAANAVVADGKLLITARKEDLSSAADWGGQHYSSARLITRGKADWTYGFF